jgi:ribonuclease Z
MIEITLLGTGNPIPDPNRAGPATLVRAGGQVFLVDCGRGVLQRAAAIGLGANGLSALCSPTCTATTSPISATC